MQTRVQGVYIYILIYIHIYTLSPYAIRPNRLKCSEKPSDELLPPTLSYFGQISTAVAPLFYSCGGANYLCELCILERFHGVRYASQVPTLISPKFACGACGSR